VILSRLCLPLQSKTVRPMVHIGPDAFRQLRVGAISVLAALLLTACGSVNVGSGGGSAGTSSPASGPTPPESNSPPQISGTPATTVIAGQGYAFLPTASDPDGDELTFSITNMPDWASFDAASGLLNGTPPLEAVGTSVAITISVSDGQSTVSLPAFSISIVAPLTISGTPATEVAVGGSYDFAPSTNAASGTALTFSAANLPSWAAFNTSTGELTGMPTQAGTFGNIVISVTDGIQTSALDAFAIAVAAPNPTNHPPVISGQAATTARVGTAYSFTPTASDPDGDTLTFSIANRPSWLSFSSTTGTLSGTPGAAAAGTYSNIVISVSDGTTSAALPGFAIQVAAALAISGTPATSVSAGSAYSFQPTTNAKAGTKLTFTVQNLPSWASFSSATGAIGGTPSATQTGTYAGIVISVSDGTQTSSLSAFSIKVGSALAISGSPASQVAAGSAYSFKPTTNASSGTALTFSIQNKPAWGSFSTATGMLSGTPSASQTGTYSNIVISVSDGSQTSSLSAFTIKVIAASTLSIAGTPAASVNVSSAYSFTPTVSNPGGAALTFSIQNKPTWLTFNSASGQLSGTPSAANAGSYSNIGISVSNGSSSASLAAFTITVNQASNGSATLDWTAVTQNMDGTTLTNLAGYNIHYGTSAGNMSQTIQVTNASLTAYVVTNLSSGAWYFAVAAYTSGGSEGELSNVGSKTIP
jgi:large repetitive protein